MARAAIPCSLDFALNHIVPWCVCCVSCALLVRAVSTTAAAMNSVFEHAFRIGRGYVATAQSLRLLSSAVRDAIEATDDDSGTVSGAAVLSAIEKELAGSPPDSLNAAVKFLVRLDVTVLF